MNQSHKPIGKKLTEILNRDCFCIAVDREALEDHLAAHLSDDGLPARLLDEPSRLFADSPVFLWRGHLDTMQALIRAVESVVQNPAYRQAVFDRAPGIARADHGPRGVFFGFDFHLGPDGPQLIEINTNAGGALLNGYLADAQQACCREVREFFGTGRSFAEVGDTFIEMFKEEWRLQRGDVPLRGVAIVDHQPAKQFLYPEMLLFESLFRRHGIEATIADPTDLTWERESLKVGNQRIDLVYNRLTDFYFETPACRPLADAYRRGDVVVTPSPHAYALYADKRNLVLLSDPHRLRDMGVPEDTIRVITESLPTSTLVTQENADELWRDRKQLFFKPVTGHGSRGAYRGAKITRRVWGEIVHSGYIAQKLIPPSERELIVRNERRSLKLDLRCVTYQGQIQQVSARLYRGQTTNLRTEGGGLATVFTMPEISG